MSRWRGVTSLFPGIGLSGVVAMAAWALERLEQSLSGSVWIDGLVLAIVLGTGIHTVCGLGAIFKSGIEFSSKVLLEIAVVLLGSSISLAVLAASGMVLIVGIAAVVMVSLALSYGIGRMLGLDERLAILVSCGNSICGNSAIVATAPVIGATSEDIAASIAFTAALGVIVVLVLPLAVPLLGMTGWQYGVLAGVSVYAVPQVIAATAPIGALSTQVGTLVKLVRVLMLGPVVLALGLKHGRKTALRPKLGQLVPWFILGFLVLMFMRSAGLLPEPALEPIRLVSNILTVISMAALGLSVDLRKVMASGGRVLCAGVLSISMLTILGLVLALSLSPVP